MLYNYILKTQWIEPTLWEDTVVGPRNLEPSPLANEDPVEAMWSDRYWKNPPHQRKAELNE